MIPFWLLVLIQLSPVIVVSVVMVWIILSMMGFFYDLHWPWYKEPVHPHWQYWYPRDTWFGERWRAFWGSVE